MLGEGKNRKPFMLFFDWNGFCQNKRLENGSSAIGQCSQLGKNQIFGLNFRYGCWQKQTTKNLHSFLNPFLTKKGTD
jgi:hypothetical protein